MTIWHDIAPDGRAAFHAWHGEEHMPERVGTPGVLLLERCGDEASFAALCTATLPDDLLRGAGARAALGHGLYRLQNWRFKTDWTA